MDRKYLTITELLIDRLEPNPWNPNRMTPEIRRKLRLNLQRDGFVSPLLVRKLDGRYQIVNGEHRWMIAKELGYQTIPCVVLDRLDEWKTPMSNLTHEEEPPPTDRAGAPASIWQISRPVSHRRATIHSTSPRQPSMPRASRIWPRPRASAP